MSDDGGTQEYARVCASRRIWTFCLASLVLLALWALAAPAFTSAYSKPSVVVLGANAAGRDTIKVTVAVKHGKGCAGKVTISTGAVHAHANLSAHKGFCQALLHLKLPKADFGKVVAFRLRIAGAKGVSHFALTVHVHLVAPPPSRTPTIPTPPAEQIQDGTYRWILNEGKEGKGGVWSEGEMIVKGGKLTNIGLYTSSPVTVECAGGPEKSRSTTTRSAP